jgi:hypothetical protein
MSGSGWKVSIPSFFLVGASATVRLLREQFLSTRAARPASEDESQGQAKAATPSRPPRACKGKAKLGKEARPDTRERLGKPGLSLFGRGKDRRPIDYTTICPEEWQAPGASCSSLPYHNESIAQPFLANEVEQHGSMLWIEPDTSGRRWSAQARNLIRTMDGVVAIIED